MTRQVMQVEVRGVVYPTVRAAAEAFGIGTNTIYQLLEKGRADMIGMGRARPNNGGYRCKPFTIAGVTYRSQQDASVAIGRNKDYVSWAIRKGSEDAVKQMHRAFEELHAKEGYRD